MTTPLSKPPKANQAPLYECDYYKWLETTINQLQEKKFTEIDLINLIEELEDMGRSQKDGLESNLQIVLIHLLKYKYQPEKRSSSWRYTILEHRDRLENAFENSPSLKPYFEQVFTKSYGKARKKAAVKTDLPLELFPAESPFTLEETLNADYLPE